MVIWLVGMSGAGKTTIGRRVAALWRSHAANTVFLDGDELREVFGRVDPATDYTIAARRENSRRASALCAMLDRQGINVVCALLSIFEDHRAANRRGFSSYFEVFVDTPREVLEARDPKGIYRDARAGRMRDVVGFDIPFEPPAAPDLVLRNADPPLDADAAALAVLRAAGVLR